MKKQEKIYCTLFVLLFLVCGLSIVTATTNNTDSIDKEQMFKEVENKEYRVADNVELKRLNDNKIKLNKKKDSTTRKTAESKKNISFSSGNVSYNLQDKHVNIPFTFNDTVRDGKVSISYGQSIDNTINISQKTNSIQFDTSDYLQGLYPLILSYTNSIEYNNASTITYLSLYQPTTISSARNEYNITLGENNNRTVVYTVNRDKWGSVIWGSIDVYLDNRIIDTLIINDQTRNTNQIILDDNKLENILPEKHTLRAEYNTNDPYTLKSQHTSILNIEKQKTTTTITITNNTVENVRVTGTVKDKYGRNVAEGTVTIKHTNTIIGRGTLSNGVYNIRTSITSKGTYNIRAEYDGTNKYNPSNSNNITINVAAKTPTITVTPKGNKVGNTSITATIKDPNGNCVANAPIIVSLSDGSKVTMTTNKDGTANIPLDLRSGNNNITVTYNGNGTYTPITRKTNITVTKNTPIIKLNTVRGVIGENIILTAYLTGVNGEKITGGNLAYKLNGKTLRSDGRFDSNAPAMKFKVENGLVTHTIKADLYLRNAKNLTAAYSGNYKYTEIGSPTVTAQIQKRYAKVTVTASPTWNKQYNQVTFKATVQDTTKNHKNTTLINQNTKIMFKVNGNTLKDKNGKIIYITVDKNKQATHKYTIPAGTGGITSTKKVRNYNVTAVFVGDNYYPGARNNTYYNVERSPITININEAKTNKNNILSIKATIKDYKQNNVLGTNKYTIKINGKSCTKNGKPVYWSAKNGNINLNGIQIDPKTTVKRVMIVTGERQAYHEGRNETTKIMRTWIKP